MKIVPYASKGTNLLQGDNERGQKGTPLTVKDLTRIVSKINPASYNPRIDLQPGDIEYEKLKRSIQEFGYVEPLIWNEQIGNLVGGHQRFKILVEQGTTEIEVSIVSLDEIQEKALNIAA
ncbi:ParB N-terminal domain-containing protein [Brevibacillus brevis]|uniref:ParB N-terminal domain-containing protein n=1 Tax=Brevibacillus brevis TaxID=1393 RepID=UPI0003179411|nr:ParB N-terminal domain-containing protein [Brevibacillus brevis]